MITKNEVYNHIGDALQNALPEDGSAELAMDHNKLFLRMGNQVFAITVEEKRQFQMSGEKVAREFMASNPFWPWNRR